MDMFGKKEQFLPEEFKSECGHLFESYIKDFSAAKTFEAKMQVSAQIYEFLADGHEVEPRFRQVKHKVNFKNSERSKRFRTKGNTVYQSGDYKEAIRLYTKSIASAPVFSAELPLAHANRSAVLRSMGKCRECLVDIQRALSHGYPKDQSFKLLLREMQCHRDLENTEAMNISFKKASNLLQSLSGLTEKEKSALQQQLDQAKQAPCMEVCNEEVIFPTEVPELSYGPNPEVVGASNAVRIEYNEQQGRHLVATRDIEIGDVLLVTEILVATVNDCSKFDHCAHCQKPCSNLIPCPNCVWVLFCSSECQTEANKKYHKNECAPYSRMQHILNDLGMLGDAYDRIIRLLAYIGIDNLQPYFKYARSNTKAPMSNEAKRMQGFNSDGMFDTYNIDAIFNLCSMIECRNQMDLLFESNNLIYIPRSFGMSMKHRDFYAVAGLCLRLREICEVSQLKKSYFLTKPDLSKPPLDVAQSFDPLNSLVNHGCFYNLTSVNCGNKSVRMAKWPIAKGSVLTEFYLSVELMQSPKKVRQALLKESFSFDCKCEACENNWDLSVKFGCIFDPKDAELATKLSSIGEEEIVEMCRNLPPADLASKVDDFKKERYELLTKLWEKREFQDIRAKKIAYQIFVYNLMQGNRFLHHVGKHDEEQEDDESESSDSAPICALQ